MLSQKIFYWMILADKEATILFVGFAIKASRLLPYSLLFFMLFAFAGCSHQNALLKISGSVMGTSYHIKLLAPEGADQQGIVEGVISALGRVDELMSTYKNSSEVSSFNRAKINEWMPVSEQTWQVVKLSKEIAGQSKGAFDITVAPLIALWGFGWSSSFQLERKLPRQADILHALDNIDMDAIELKQQPFALRRTRAVTIDLSAIAKGYAVDQVVDYLLEQGVQSALIEIGGEVRALGSKPDNSPWLVGIEKPSIGRGEAQVALAIKNVAIATSGDYRNYYEVDGKRYSHTIDPRSGRPVSHKLVSVTVLSASAALADALATAINVMGPEQGFEFARAEGIAAFFIVKGDEGFKQFHTESFEQYLH